MNPWPSVSLGSLISSIRGGTSYGGENRRPATGEVGILTLGAVGGDRFDPDACKALPAAILPQLGDPVRADTLLMTRSNTIDLVGSVVYVDADHSDRFLPDLIWELSLHADVPLRPAFLADFLSTADGRRLLQSAAMGTSGSMKKLSMARLKRLKVPSVPVALQDAWLKVRNQIDRLQVHGHDLLTAKRAFKRALMNDLLTGRRRFPEFVQSTNSQPSPLGQIPADWTAVPISEVAARVTRKNVDDEAVVLTCSGAHGLIDHKQFFSKMIASEAREDYFLLHRGEFAYNRSSMTGYPVGAIKRLDRYHAGVLSTLNICFSLTEEAYHSDFAVHLFESGLLNRQLGRVARVGSRAHGLLNVTTNDFLQLVVPVPPAAEQHRVAATLGVLGREIELLEEQRSSLKRLKKGLMQRLLSGKIGLPERLTAVDARGEAHDDDS